MFIGTGIRRRLLLALLLGCAGVGLFGSSALAYNRGAAVTYADAWSNNCNEFGCTKLRNTGPPRYYIDYSANDCTNFISQAMYAGGLPEINDGYIHEDRNWWWGGNDTNRSDSWAAVISLRNHAYLYLGNRFDAKSDYTGLQPGDFFVMDLVYPYNTDPTHGRFWIGLGTDVETGQYGGIIDQHSSERRHILYTRYWDPTGKSVWKIHVR